MQLVFGFLRHSVRTVLYGAVGAVLTLLAVGVMYLVRRSDLEVLHTVELDEEFTRQSGLADFQSYLDLEQRLFTQLQEEVYARTSATDALSINRYQSGSLADPERWSPNWNRSYLMERDEPRAAVLLLHGLSDSPYSLHRLARRLHGNGATVLGLRVPGHGTAPSGLVTVRWPDMAAAVDLAARHLAQIAPGRPLYLVGYSNGAALAVHFALTALEDPERPQAERLVLISPEIGVTPAAALAVWQARLGHLLGLDKLAWNDILPEYEPFKYGSFAVNAGDVSYRITAEIQRLLGESEANGRIGGLPPILAFSSVIDATVSAPALVSNLFNRLPSGGHELVLFDLNRQAGIENILKWKPDAMLDALREAPQRNYDLVLVTNARPDAAEVEERTWLRGATRYRSRPLGLSWPKGMHSLSHVALPFAPDDPLYGGEPSVPSPGIWLGAIELRGERGALAISESAMLRLRWNPFYSYLEDRATTFLDLGDSMSEQR